MLHDYAGGVSALFDHGGFGYFNDTLNWATPDGAGYLLASRKVFNLVQDGAHIENLALARTPINPG
jgi:hypothetical protein